MNLFKSKEVKKKLKFRKFAKQHQDRINLNKEMNRLHPSMYAATFCNR